MEGNVSALLREATHSRWKLVLPGALPRALSGREIPSTSHVNSRMIGARRGPTSYPIRSGSSAHLRSFWQLWELVVFILLLHRLCFLLKYVTVSVMFFLYRKPYWNPGNGQALPFRPNILILPIKFFLRI